MMCTESNILFCYYNCYNTQVIINMIYYNNMSENMCSSPMLLFQISLDIYIPSLGNRFLGTVDKKKYLNML